MASVTRLRDALDASARVVRDNVEEMVAPENDLAATLGQCARELATLQDILIARMKHKGGDARADAALLSRARTVSAVLLGAAAKYRRVRP